MFSYSLSSDPFPLSMVSESLLRFFSENVKKPLPHLLNLPTFPSQDMEHCKKSKNTEVFKTFPDFRYPFIFFFKTGSFF